jgi:argininosuccinate lyase
VSEVNPSETGRLTGGKSQSYVRAVNVIEARASRFTTKYMLASDIAYVLTAVQLKLTPTESARKLIVALLSLIDDLDGSDQSMPPGDVVSQREAWIASMVGKQDAAWLHLGRNRGESLRCYLPRMFFRQTLHDAGFRVAQLLGALVGRASRVLDAIAPNYHHLQHSGFTTLGEYLLSWAAVFERHLERLQQVDRRLDCGPSVFGSRAQLKNLYDGVGTKLGFTRRTQLRRDGIWVHDQFTEPFFVLSLIAVDLARFAQDLRAWMTPEFGFVDLADEHAGGSSALPHAKVPFALQSVIGGAVMASTRLAGEMAAACNPSEGSEPLYQSGSLYQLSDDILAWTHYMADVVEKAQFDLDELRRKATFDYAGSSEAHDRLAYDFGVPFRIGHRILGRMVRAHHLQEPIPNLKELLKAETGRDIDVNQDEIMEIVLGERIWPTTFDPQMLRETLLAYEQKAQAATRTYGEASRQQMAIDSLLHEARAWASRPSSQMTAG